MSPWYVVNSPTVFARTAMASEAYADRMSLPLCAGGGVQVKESQKKRFASVELVDEVIKLDTEWRQGEASCPCVC